MRDEHLKQFLQQQSEQEIPNTMDLRERIHQQVVREYLVRQRRSPVRRPLLIVAILMMTVTATYALYQTVVVPDSGIRTVQNQNLVVDINQTQAVTPQTAFSPEISGIDVTVDYAYADANRITVAYSAVASPGDAQAELYLNPTLTDNAGNSYLWLSSSGQQTVDRENSRTSGIMSFDASSLVGMPDTLNLNLKLEVAYTTAATRANDPMGMLLAGAAQFTFALPFNPGQSIQVNQTASANGLNIDVQQVVIAPSLTRIDVCYDPTLFAGDAWLDWRAVVSLSVDGEPVATQQEVGIEGFIEASDRCRSLTIAQALVANPGTWTLTIHDFHNLSTGDSLTGDWEYTFQVN